MELCAMCRGKRGGVVVTCHQCGVRVCPDCCEEHVSGHAIEKALLERDGRKSDLDEATPRST